MTYQLTPKSDETMRINHGRRMAEETAWRRSPVQMKMPSDLPQFTFWQRVARWFRNP